MVKRYSVGVDGVDPKGNLVRYKDYAELEKRIAELEKLFSQEQNKLIDSECHVADLEKQRDALVAENAALKSMNANHCAFDRIVRMPDSPTDDMTEAAWSEYTKHANEDNIFPFSEMYYAAVKAFGAENADIETPQTDAAIAEIGARAVEGFKEYVLSRGYPFKDDWGLVNGCYNSYMNKLRGGGV